VQYAGNGFTDVKFMFRINQFPRENNARGNARGGNAHERLLEMKKNE